MSDFQQGLFPGVPPPVKRVKPVKRAKSYGQPRIFARARFVESCSDLATIRIKHPSPIPSPGDLVGPREARRVIAKRLGDLDQAAIRAGHAVVITVALEPSG